jgi:hypothetical protein
MKGAVVRSRFIATAIRFQKRPETPRHLYILINGVSTRNPHIWRTQT